MAYRVEVTARAVRDLRRIFGAINATYSNGAADWFNGLEALVLSLETHPGRGAVVRGERNLRQVFYGKTPYAYRIIHSIDEPAWLVRVGHIRHGARR